MFTSDAVQAINASFNWIWQFVNIHPPGMNISLWQLAIGLFFFRYLWKIVLGLLNTRVSGVGYRGSSYHNKRDSEKDKSKE